MAFSCMPTTPADPRVKLLKQATLTGMPARSRESERSISTMGRTPSRASTNSYNNSVDSHSHSHSLHVPPPPPLETLEELLLIPLAVDIATVFDEDSEDSESTVFNPPAQRESGRAPANSVGAFTRRAFVAQGSYRIGWIIDSERRDCIRCRRGFGPMNRRHHCRGCGDVFCGECTKYRSSVPCLIGNFHRVCGHCYEKFADQFSSNSSVASLQSRRSEPCRTRSEASYVARASKSKEI